MKLYVFPPLIIFWIASLVIEGAIISSIKDNNASPANKNALQQRPTKMSENP